MGIRTTCRPVAAKKRCYTREHQKKERQIPMKQYFDFTPYVTDTPVSFTITSGSFMDFICEQLTAANIPFSKNVHMRKLDDGGPVAGTDLIAPPSRTFSHVVITAPLAKPMVNRLIANNDRKTFNTDSIMKNAYIAWYKNAIEEDLAWD